MLKRLQQLFLLFLTLVVLYLVLVRALLTWVQVAPEHFLPLVEKVSQSQIQVQHLKIDQTWLGFEFELAGVQFESPDVRGHLDTAKGDFNLLALFFGNWQFGEQLILNGLEVVWSKPKAEESPSPSFLEFSEQAWSLFYQSWQLVNLTDIKVSVSHAEEVLTLGVASLQTYRGVKWTLGGVLTLQVDDAEESRIQFKGSFSPLSWHDALDGAISANILTPVLLKPFYRLMPKEWIETLPSGALLGDLDMEIKRGELAKLTIRTHTQNLVWPENDDLLPKSFGIDLNWVATNQLKGRASENWQFKIENLRFDKAYVENISPIYIRLDQNQFLTFRAAEIDFEVIRPIVHLLARTFKYDQFGQNIQQLKFIDVNGALDIVDLKLTTLRLKIPKFTLDAHQNHPGFSVRDLSIEKQQNDLWIKSPQPVPITLGWIDNGRPLSLQVPETLHITFDESEANWQLDPVDFDLASIPMTLVANGSASGKMNVDLKFKPEKLAVVKRYLPYDFMSETLRDWINLALVSGDGIKGALKVQGNLQDFPFEDGQGLLELTAEVQNATLKFQPNWPAVTGVSAQLKFKPYQLDIQASSVVLSQGFESESEPLVAQAVQISIPGLDSKNIDVEIQGKVEASLKHAVHYLQQTPLVKQAGLDDFLKEQVQLSGKVKINLETIRIPVYGYHGQSETVSGRVALESVEMKLFDTLAISKLKGNLQFTETSIQSDALRASVFEREAVIQLSTEKNLLKVTAEGEAVFDDSFVEGALPWQTLVKIPLKSDQAITVQSKLDLKAAKFKLPAPFSEKAMSEANNRPSVLVADAIVQDNQLNLTVKAGSMIDLESNVDIPRQQLNYFKLLFNHPKPSNHSEQKRGSQVQGQLHSVDLEGWLDVLPTIQKLVDDKFGLSASDQEPIFWQHSTLKIAQLTFLETQVDQLNLDWSSVPSSGKPFLVVSLQSDALKASMKQVSKHQYNLNLTQLALDIPVLNAPSKDENLSCQEPKLPGKQPETKVFFMGENIHINGKVIDQMSFDLINTTDLLKIAQVKLYPSQIKKPFEGQYLYNKLQNTSQLSGSIKTKQVEPLLEFLGFNKGFKGSEMRLGVNLEWQGEMECFSLKQLEGGASFKMEDGVIENAEPGFARVLGLLSFESLARRLRLNVNDFTEAGLVYDSIEGDGEFKQGLFVINKLELKAPAAKAKVFGQVSLLNNQLDLKAEVTPSIGSSLPALAAISGFATPIAGFAAYVFMKYMPFVNEDIVTYRYDVTGSFEQPILKEKGPSIELFKLSKEKSPTPKGLEGFE